MKHLTNAFNGQNQWWKYLLLFLASFFGGQIVGGIPLIIVMAVKMLQNGNISPNTENMGDLSVFGIGQNLGLFLMIIPFIVSLVVLLLLIKPLHKRNYKTLFSGISSIRWNRFIVATFIWAILMGIYLLIDYQTDPNNFTLNFDASSFIVLCIISLSLIPIQASYEEIMFRGYLAQGVAAWTKNRLLAILLPSLLFGLLHILNPEVKEFGFWLVMPQYILFGLIFGLVSVLDDGIELAMGAHTANNVFLSLFVTHKSSTLQTPALFVQQNMDAGKDLLVMILVGIIFIGIISKIYKFNFSILTKRINTAPDTEIQY